VAPGVTSVGAVRSVTHDTSGGSVPETTQDEIQTETPVVAEEALVEESLVEEVSIDGMCGVY